MVLYIHLNVQNVFMCAFNAFILIVSVLKYNSWTRTLYFMQSKSCDVWREDTSVLYCGKWFVSPACRNALSNLPFLWAALFDEMACLHCLRCISCPLQLSFWDIWGVLFLFIRLSQEFKHYLVKEGVVKRFASCPLSHGSKLNFLQHIFCFILRRWGLVVCLSPQVTLR